MPRQRNEIDEVTQKVQNTRKEIDHLKAELDKLIKSGINSTKPSVSAHVEKENLALNFHGSQDKSESRIIFRNVSDVDKQDLKSARSSSHISRKDIPRPLLSPINGAASRNTSKSPTCNKKCSYNRDEAREYIKKQREKRKEQAKLSEKSHLDAELKKQKLKELHQKSLLLLKKNVEHKRKRSKSRETDVQTDNIAQGKNEDLKNGCQAVLHIPDLIMTNVVDNKIKHSTVQKINKNSEKSNNYQVSATRNIEPSISAEIFNKEQMKNVTVSRGSSRHSVVERNNAAITIQSYFRGYMQRKRYRKMKEDKNQIAIANRNKATAETQTEIKSKTTPNWLNPSAVSHPYNFINTVKRKLNFAINASSPGVRLQTPEHSFHLSTLTKTPSDQLFQKTKDELKDVIKKSAKVEKNHNGNLWELIAQMRAADGVKSPELLVLKKSHVTDDVRNCHENNIHSKNNVNSDSDTSNNIPNISRETSADTIVKTKKTSSIDTDYPTDSDFSEPKLDTDRLKHLQLQPTKYTKENIEALKKKSTSSATTIKTMKSFSEPNLISSNENKLDQKSPKGSTKSVDDFPGKNTITASDILAFNISPLRSMNNDQLQPPTNLNIQLSKTNSKNVSPNSKSTTSHESSIKTDTQSASNNSYSSNFSAVSSKHFLSVPPLSYPDVTVYPQKVDVEGPLKTKSVISLKEDGDKAVVDTRGNCNEIHLKIEAELHLINDVNESLKKFMDLEKSVLELRDKHIQNPAPKQVPEKSSNEIQTINYSRGSDISEIMNYSLQSSDLEFDRGILSSGFNISNSFNDTKDSNIAELTTTGDESILKEPFVKVSLGTFEQLIKDEDRRIENLKIILKFRQKTLLDRTKSELALLEIQRKHLKETGQLHEASLLKKKQRGILMRMQHEHHEMQRLKQIQKTASKERKEDLKQKRNMIKSQLSTNKMLTKTKLNNARENQRQSGPFKVYNIQSHSESVRSETSISRNSITEEVISVTSHSRSVVSRVSDVEVTSNRIEEAKNENDLAKVDHIKKILLMREAALQKRRKAAEEVLQWHKKLSEEEKKVAELEMVAKSIINEVAKESTDEKVLQKMTKREGTLLKDHGLTQRTRDHNKHKSDKFSEKDSSYDSINTDVDYSSDVSSAIKTDILVPNKSEQSKDSTDKQTLNNYSSDFETPISLYSKEVFPAKSTSSENIKHNDKIASITELIDNLTKINEENSILSKRSSLNKSADAELDRLTDITNSSVVRSQSKSFKVETNKLLNLKEHLHLDNNKAILDSIDSLKSSIKEITSKADRDRISKRSFSETQSTEKDISEFSNKSTTESVANLSIPEEEPKSLVAEQNATKTSRSVSDESERILLATDVSFDNTPHLSDTIKSESHTESNVSTIEDIKDSVEIESSPKTAPSASEEEEEENQVSELEDHSELTVEENKILDESQNFVESVKEIGILQEDHVEPASSLSIENSEVLETEIVEVAECDKSDLIVFTEKIENPLSQNNVLNKVNEIVTEIGVAHVIDENINQQLDALRESQYEDISDVSEHLVSDDTLNELSNDALFSHDDKLQNIITIEDKTLQEDEGISEETSLSVECLPEMSSDKNKVQIDVKKRVSEILADANVTFSKNERSPRLQDLYVTTYDLISPESSPESHSPLDNNGVIRGSLDAEAEELLKKQLAIEQEIKQIQQQHIPYILLREIPNKPPPPYTPPVTIQPSAVPSVLPSVVEQVDTASSFSADILYNAHLNSNLESVNFEEQTVDENVLKNVEKGCLKFLFDVCKDLAINHYEKFKVDEGPSWMKLVNKQKLSLNTPFNKTELDKYLNKKLKVLLGYEKVERRENAIIRWSRKKRDHVDEILVLESQAEESEWTDYDKDELYVKNDVTNEIMNMLLSETAEVFSTILKKRCEKTVDVN